MAWVWRWETAPRPEVCMSPESRRFIEIFAAVLGLLAGGLRLAEQRQLGFPDGHLTELERALRVPHVALATAAMTLAVLLLATRPPKDGRRGLVVALAAVLLVDGLVVSAVGRLLGLADGGGG